MADYAVIVAGLWHCHHPGASPGHSSGHLAGAHSVSRPESVGQPDQYRHGAATGGRGPFDLSVALAQRAAWLFAPHLYPCCDGHSPGSYRLADCGRAYHHGHSDPQSTPEFTASWTGRLTAATPVAALQGGTVA